MGLSKIIVYSSGAKTKAQMTMMYNFDEVINRNNTDSVKFDGPKQVIPKHTYLPMWVADMDFKTPQPVVDEVRRRLDLGVLGYTFPSDEWSKSIERWVEKRYNWKITSDEILFTPGIVRGIAFALNCFTKPGDKIMVMSPVYPPFFNVSKANKREVVFHRMLLKDYQFQVDFVQFEKDLQGCTVFILCNPHNPGGRVWSREEMVEMAAICKRNNVLVISDEIHADLTLPPLSHITFPSVSKEAKENSIVFMAPSKAFNMPGLASSYCFIQNKEIREVYKQFVEALDVASGNMFAYSALVAAYEKSADWLPQVCSYIQGNIDYVAHQLPKLTPKIKMITPQASFLIFLDCRELKLTSEELQNFFVFEAGLVLNEGISFGPGGEGFMRLNIGCPRKILDQAMNQLKLAYEKRGF